MKKNKLIAVIAGVLILSAAVLICLLPHTTTLDYTLNAVCFNVNGKQTGTTQIVVQGHKTNKLFRDPQFELSVLPFDRLTWLQIIETEGENPVYQQDDIRFSYYVAGDNRSGEVVQITVGFDSNLDRWIFINHARKVYYVASSSGNYSAEELSAYFISLIPANW